MSSSSPQEPPAARGARSERGLRRLTTRVADSPWFSYATIFALQLCTVWGVWNSPRLGFGDTSSYFVAAESFAERGVVANIVMSPLYTVFYGTVYAAAGDPYAATWWHRILIVLAAAMLGLAVFRRLLPPAVAWLLAAWWAVSPIIYDTLYEVHLFGALPILAACLAAAHASPWGRGVALAIMALGGLLVRNELTAAAILFACGCLYWEWSLGGRADERRSMTKLALAYTVPLLVAVGVVLSMYARVPADFNVERVMDHRHRVNMAQVFAFGYQQRHPEWTKSPWLEYAELTTEHFGVAEPSLGEMVANNPRAAIDHFLWNLRLLPNGLQLLLFSRISGSLNPDYPAPPSNSPLALVLTLILLLIWIAGGATLIRNWNLWWESRIRESAPAWLVLVAAALMAPSIILTQRPRPSYLFGLGAFLMACTGLCVTALVYSPSLSRAQPTSTPTLRSRLVSWWPLAALAVLAAAVVRPSPYPDATTAVTQIFPNVERLLSRRSLLRRPAEKLYTANFHGALQNFVCAGQCQPESWQAFGGNESALAPYLESGEITAVYAEDILLRQLGAQPGELRPFVDYLPEPWLVLDSGADDSGRWRLFHKGPAD